MGLREDDMQLDDRDIICEQDYSPLSNAELVAAIERYADIMSNAPLIDFDLEWITGPARALLARAEAAEALAYERLENMLFAEQRANDLEALMALGVDVPPPDDGRVGEAAQQWRPVTE